MPCGCGAPHAIVFDDGGRVMSKLHSVLEVDTIRETITVLVRADDGKLVLESLEPPIIKRLPDGSTHVVKYRPKEEVIKGRYRVVCRLHGPQRG